MNSLYTEKEPKVTISEADLKEIVSMLKSGEESAKYCDSLLEYFFDLIYKVKNFTSNYLERYTAMVFKTEINKNSEICKLVSALDIYGKQQNSISSSYIQLKRCYWSESVHIDKILVTSQNNNIVIVIKFKPVDKICENDLKTLAEIFALKNLVKYLGKTYRCKPSYIINNDSELYTIEVTVEN